MRVTTWRKISEDVNTSRGIQSGRNGLNAFSSTSNRASAVTREKRVNSVPWTGAAATTVARPSSEVSVTEGSRRGRAASVVQAPKAEEGGFGVTGVQFGDDLGAVVVAACFAGGEEDARIWCHYYGTSVDSSGMACMVESVPK